MKQLLILLLFIAFSSNITYAKDSKKITVEDVEISFFKKKTRHKRTPEAYESHLKRMSTRGIAKCMYDYSPDLANYDKCYSKIIRTILAYPEKSKIKRPGDIFYVLNAFDLLVDGFYKGQKQKKFTKTLTYYEGEQISKYFKKHEPMPGMVCGEPRKLYNSQREVYSCTAFKKKYFKKFEKFKKNPTNEKVLGKALIKHINNVKMVNSIIDKIGTNNYALIGDMLNAVVADVKENELNPHLKIRRSLLKKYSLILNNIKKKIKEDNFKSIDSEISKLSKIYDKLKALNTNTDEIVINIDKAINVLFEVNKFIQISAINAKNGSENKLLALSSIEFMSSLVDSILIVIPKKYYALQKELGQDLFIKEELDELEIIISTMVKVNNKKKAEFYKNLNVINKFIDTAVILEKLENLGIKNKFNKPFTQNTAAILATNHIRDNLDNELLKEARKIIEIIDKNDLSDLTKEVTKVANEISSDRSVKTTMRSSYPDPKFGGQSLKALIYMSR